MGHLVGHLGDRSGRPGAALSCSSWTASAERDHTAPAAKALTLVAVSPLKISLQPILAEALPILASFRARTSGRCAAGHAWRPWLRWAQSQGPGLPPSASCVAGAGRAARPGQRATWPSWPWTSSLPLGSAPSRPPWPRSAAPCWPSCCVAAPPLLPAGVLMATEGFLQALVGTCRAAVAGLRQAHRPAHCTRVPSRQQRRGPGLHKQVFHSLARSGGPRCGLSPGGGRHANRLVGKGPGRPARAPGSRSWRSCRWRSVGQVAGPGPQRELKAVLLEALGSPSEDVRAAASLRWAAWARGTCLTSCLSCWGRMEAEPGGSTCCCTRCGRALGAAQPDSLKPYAEDIWALLFQRCGGARRRAPGGGGRVTGSSSL